MTDPAEEVHHTMIHTDNLLGPATSGNTPKDAATPGITSAILVVPAPIEPIACIASVTDHMLFASAIIQAMSIIASAIVVPLQAAPLAALMPQAVRVIAAELPAVTGIANTGITTAAAVHPQREGGTRGGKVAPAAAHLPTQPAGHLPALLNSAQVQLQANTKSVITSIGTCVTGAKELPRAMQPSGRSLQYHAAHLFRTNTAPKLHRVSIYPLTSYSYLTIPAIPVTPT